MFLKKVEGPRAVSLPDGSVLTRADIPPADTVRWVASRKAAVVKAVRFGLLTREETLSTYDISDEELQSWEKAVKKHGETALKVTRTQRFRQL